MIVHGILVANLKVDTEILFILDGFISGMRQTFWLFYGPVKPPWLHQWELQSAPFEEFTHSAQIVV